VAPKGYIMSKDSSGKPFRHLWVIVLALLLSASFGCGGSDTGTPAAKPSETAKADEAEPTLLDTGSPLFPSYASERWTDDLDSMKVRKVIRALVTFSNTDFFLLRGQPRGFQAEMLAQYEEFLNQGVSQKDKVRVVFLPVPFDQLIPALQEGKGDIAAALLTITPERQEAISFATGGVATVDEIVVASAGADSLGSVEDLAGRSVYVLSGSSHQEHLTALSDGFKKAGRKPIEIVTADSNLLAEDILEMVNAGVVDYTISDDYTADLWSQVLPDLILYPELTIHTDGKIGWGVRKDNPELLASLNAFAQRAKRGTRLGNTLLKRYFEDTRWIDNPISNTERARLDEFVALFKKYGDQYGFDWLALAAQGYQESGLNPGAKSKKGAVGIMQLLPSTAADQNVNIANIHETENNIHAAAKYMAFLRKRYFKSAEIPPEEQLAFTWAAYNAGPARINKLRERAEKAGLDPNQWFGNVEYIAFQTVGQQPVRYVENIYKYYVGYKLIEELLVRKAEATEKG
jgi:membrane-bound lytic murein transglycosylase MltF